MVLGIYTFELHWVYQANQLLPLQNPKRMESLLDLTSQHSLQMPMQLYPSWERRGWIWVEFAVWLLAVPFIRFFQHERGSETLLAQLDLNCSQIRQREGAFYLFIPGPLWTAVKEPYCPKWLHCFTWNKCNDRIVQRILLNEVQFLMSEIEQYGHCVIWNSWVELKWTPILLQYASMIIPSLVCNSNGRRRSFT